jgi:hypothetical protein
MPYSLQNPDRPTQGPITQINSLPVAVNPNRALNCFWEMPFRRHAKITLENRNPTRSGACFYQINYCLTDVPEQAAYFHAQFRRTNPLPYLQPYTILDGVQGRGHYVGTSMGWSINNRGWWGEGEIKFYLDGDGEWPTICGTGTEDYFGGAWGFEQPAGSMERLLVPFLRDAAGDQAGWSQQRQHTLWPLPLARDGSHSFQAGPARNDAGAWLAHGAGGQDALSRLAGRYRVHGFLVSGRATRSVQSPASL